MVANNLIITKTTYSFINLKIDIIITLCILQTGNVPSVSLSNNILFFTNL